MKYPGYRSLIVILAAACLTALLSTAATAGITYYVNSKNGYLDMDIGEAYAIGSGGTARIAGVPVSVMTAGGLVTLGKPVNSDPAQASLSVSGTIKISADVIKVGIQYGNSAAETASMQNIVGNGFKFGYYDAHRRFHEVGSTSDRAITAVIDRNVSLSSGFIGCYHILLPGVYSSFQEASAVAGSWPDGFVGYYSGSYRVLLGSYASREEAAAAVAARGVTGEAYTASSKCVTVVRTGTTRILFEFDYGSVYSLGIEPNAGEDRPVTSLGSGKYHGGFQFARLDGGKMTVVNFVDVEDYVMGVVASEMNESWPLEALKAQAVAARTYVLRNLGGYAQYGFDVTNTAASQAYSGASAVGSNIVAAVGATKGLYLTYKGKLCDSVYFSSDGGGTEDSENVFYEALDYLRGVIDPYEEAAAGINKYSSWTRSWNKKSIAEKITAQGYSFGTLVDITPEYSDTGNVISITFKDSSGRTVTFSGSKCFAFCYYGDRLNLPSIHFTVELSETNPDVYVFKGSGWGHNVGMSQFGAYAMAKYYGKTYDQILAFYYTGVGLSQGVTD